MTSSSRNPFDSYISTNGNQSFFMNAPNAQLTDSVVKSADTAPPGDLPKGSSVNFGNGAAGIIVRNTVIASYSGGGKDVDLTKFLTETPMLPLAAGGFPAGYTSTHNTQQTAVHQQYMASAGPYTSNMVVAGPPLHTNDAHLHPMATPQPNTSSWANGTIRTPARTPSPQNPVHRTHHGGNRNC
ncbi:unnamed protein product [Cyclocybe aegerita]|uniref:Uncharacterized protein n=1 Tax=Cyclocybe aegerita TaxID=1973307 RepID=A0A8S0XR15_CYCAE|nr:unnamed protein product [Cyclocybe aegerita]